MILSAILAMFVIVPAVVLAFALCRMAALADEHHPPEETE